jgi:hypothetical protein
MKDEGELNKEFFYLFADDVDLLKKINRIDDIWKKIYLNKASLVTLTIQDEDDSFIDVHAEHSLMNGNNGFRLFKKRGL